MVWQLHMQTIRENHEQQVMLLNTDKLMQEGISYTREILGRSKKEPTIVYQLYGQTLSVELFWNKEVLLVSRKYNHAFNTP